jgi:hypothetical protein
MLIKHPFFATLLMSTPMDQMVPADAAEVPDDGHRHGEALRQRGVHRDADDDEILFVLAHEVMHIALAHGIRLQARNHFLWNIACDYAINLVLKETGFTVWKGSPARRQIQGYVGRPDLREADEAGRQAAQEGKGGGKTGDRAVTRQDR